MELTPSETELIGFSEFKNGPMEGKAAEKRIDWSIANSLKKIASTGGGWKNLYLDPNDGRASGTVISTIGDAWRRAKTVARYLPRAVILRNVWLVF